MDRVAILVLGHAGAGVLSHFAVRYGSAAANIYVHVDRRQSLDAYRGDRTFGDAVFLEERFAIYWGGFNMVRATLALAERALADPANAAFALVSDDSYPLVPPERLAPVLLAAGNRIDSWAIPESGEQFHRYQRFYHFDSNLSSARWMPAEQRDFAQADLDALKDAEALMARGKKPVALRGGSQWWLLTRATLSAMVAMARSDSWLAESFRFSAIPDEHFFQTLYGLLDPEAPNTRSPMMTDFTREPKPFVFRTVDDFSASSAEGKHFARKVAGEPQFLDEVSRLGLE